MWHYGHTIDYWAALPARWIHALLWNAEQLMARDNLRLTDAVRAAISNGPEASQYRADQARVAAGLDPEHFESAAPASVEEESPAPAREFQMESFRLAGIPIEIEED